jgi:hypothetical protein
MSRSTQKSQSCASCFHLSLLRKHFGQRQWSSVSTLVPFGRHSWLMMLLTCRLFLMIHLSANRGIGGSRARRACPGGRANPMPCLCLGRYIRFDWNAVVNWITAGAEQETNAARTSLPPKRKLVR